MKVNKIYHGDCLELMPQIKDGSIDMILCDLPYGNTDCKWDIALPIDQLWNNWLRIIKPTGAIVLTSMEPMASELIMSQRSLFRYDLIWDKVGTTGFLNSKKMPLRRHEQILVFYKKQPTYNPQKTIGKPYSKTRTKTAEVYKMVNKVTTNTNAQAQDLYDNLELYFPE